MKKVKLSDFSENMLDFSATELAESLMQDTPPSQLISVKEQFKRYKNEIKREVKTYIKRLDEGVKLLTNSLVELSKSEPDLYNEDVLDDVIKFIEKSNKALSVKDVLDYLKVFDEGSLKNYLQISEKTIESLYRAAKHIYSQKHFEEAAKAFSVLTAIDPNEYIFWHALGNCEYFCARYQPALLAYALAIQANPNDYTSQVFSAHCYEAIHDIDNALSSLDSALFITSHDKEKHKDVHRKIVSQKERLINHKKRGLL